MAMSKDRVRFYLAARYFQSHRTSNGMTRDTCIRLLFKAFGMTSSQSLERMSRFHNGFWIKCRPSQFARFIVYRHQDGDCINGIRDLQPQLVEPVDVYAQIANETGVTHDTVRRVLRAAEYVPTTRSDEIDVSKNPHMECHNG